MKILWITNIVFPEALAEITGEKTLKASGGWLIGLASTLAISQEIQLYIASTSSNVSELTKVTKNNITHFVIPLGKGNIKENKEYEKYWKVINDDINPDIAHIHGTEYSHGLAYLNASPKVPTLLSLQGLTTAIAQNYYKGLSSIDVLKNFSILEILFGCKASYKQRSFFENKIIKKTKNIIGHTSWDEKFVRQLNPNIHYFRNNETLRSSFYDGCWNYQKCKKHQIFLSQAGYTIKGLHQVIKAVSLLKDDYPNIQINIAGENILADVPNFYIKHFWKGYSKYIKSLLKKHHLEDCFHFIGPKDEVGIKKELLNSNLFICPSSIENCPNSLGEAQLLGVPCIAANVGGIPDMIPNEQCGTLYDFDDYKVLAKEIKNSFEKSRDFDNTEMRATAHLRHNPDINLQALIDVYNTVISPS